MNIILYYLLKAFSVLLCSLFHVVLTLVYWGRRKDIAAIDNPLLLVSATTLAKEIREGKTKSVDVIQAYIERILDVEPYINATVDCRFQKALEEAKEVDIMVASGKFSREQLAKEKPLLGVPFSVKLLLTVKGMRCTAGSVFFADERASEDSPCVVLMQNAGAIVIATTNVPELGLHLETKNYLHGKTCNPYDNRRTCGGSSGGEGALIGAAGSLIGLGNDFSGSLRLPGHFNGIFGHKPSADIVPSNGYFPNLELAKDYLCSGPMCRYAEDLATTMKILTSECGIPMPFGQPVDFRKLKIRYMIEADHPLIPTVDKEIAQGLEKAVSYFQQNYGAHVRKIQLPSLYKIGFGEFHHVLGKIQQLKGLKQILTHGRANNINENTDFIKFIFGKSKFTAGPLFVLQAGKIPLFYNEKDGPYYKDFLQKVEQLFVDLLDENTVILMPTFPTVAPYHNEIYPLCSGVFFMAVFNVYGLPATHCHLGMNKQGMPYGIQVAGKRNNDALTIACAIELEKAFGGWIPPGCS